MKNVFISLLIVLLLTPSFSFLATAENSSSSPVEKKVSLSALTEIEEALQSYYARFQKYPLNFEELFQEEFLRQPEIYNTKNIEYSALASKEGVPQQNFSLTQNGPIFFPVDNAILRTKEKLIATQKGTPISTPPENRQNANPLSALRLDATGGFSFVEERPIFEPIDVLTGRTSIDDSLQLGNFGNNTEANRLLLERTRRALKRYDDNYNRVPKTLSDLIAVGYLRQTDTDIAAVLLYTPSENLKNYTLSLIPQKRKIPITELSVVKTKSHDFEKMIADEKIDFTVPEITRIIPADTLFLYFSDTEKYREFFAATSNPLSEVASFLPLPNAAKIEELVAKRLGIPDPQTFLPKIKEFAFVAEEASLFPRADFALVVRFKETNDAFFASLLQNGENTFGPVGDYFVFATSADFFKRFQSVQKPLSEEKDFHYALGILDKRRSGLLYFSDSFLRKMVSPSYRIAKRRQANVVEALETLQYASWAYRDIEGKFPTSLADFEEKGYFQKDRLFDPDSYFFDNAGVATHKKWGSLFAITPATRFSIDTVTEGEKQWYETGRDSYADLYRRFFDPIGIGIIVSDKISFHTVILPLSGNEKYELLRSIVGNQYKENFDFFSNPRRSAMAKGVLSVDLKNIILTYLRKEEDIPANATKEDLLKNLRQYDSFVRLNQNAQKRILEKAKTIPDANGLILLLTEEKFRKEINDELDINYMGPLVDLLGDEWMIGGNIDRLPTLFDNGLFMGIQLADTKNAKIFVDLVAQKAMEKMSRGIDTGLFASGNKVQKKTYNGEEFFTLPVFFTNVHYSFLDDRLYLTLTEETMKSIIDKKQDGENWRRNLAFLTGEKNALFALDLTAAIKILDSITISPRLLASGLQKHVSYWAEYAELSRIVGEEKAKKYFRYLTDSFFGAKFFLQNGDLFLRTGEKSTAAATIDFDRYQGNAHKITAGLPVTKTVQSLLSAVESIGVAFAFTPHGADIKISFANPAFSKKSMAEDPTFAVISDPLSEMKSTPDKKALSPFLYAIIGGTLFLVFLSAFIVRAKKNEQNIS